MSQIKLFQSKRNLIKAQIEQAKNHHLISDKDRPILIESYEIQLKKIDEQEKDYINNLDVVFEIVTP
jgi:hypothetical protein